MPNTKKLQCQTVRMDCVTVQVSKTKNPYISRLKNELTKALLKIQELEDAHETLKNSYQDLQGKNETLEGALMQACNQVKHLSRWLDLTKLPEPRP